MSPRRIGFEQSREIMLLVQTLAVGSTEKRNASSKCDGDATACWNLWACLESLAGAVQETFEVGDGRLAANLQTNHLGTSSTILRKKRLATLARSSLTPNISCGKWAAALPLTKLPFSILYGSGQQSPPGPRADSDHRLESTANLDMAAKPPLLAHSGQVTG